MSRKEITIFGQSEIAITSPKYRKTIQELNAEIMGSDSDPYYGAPVVVLVLADGNTNTFIEDGSCVLENMMLAATSLRLGYPVSLEVEVAERKENYIIRIKKY